MVELALLPAHERLAELTTIKNKRPLTPREKAEFEQCLAVNAEVMRKVSNLHSLSKLATKTDDTEWLHEISAQTEKLAKRFIKGGIICG